MLFVWIIVIRSLRRFPLGKHGSCRLWPFGYVPLLFRSGYELESGVPDVQDAHRHTTKVVTCIQDIEYLSFCACTICLDASASSDACQYLIQSSNIVVRCRMIIPYAQPYPSNLLSWVHSPTRATCTRENSYNPWGYLTTEEYVQKSIVNSNSHILVIREAQITEVCTVIHFSRETMYCPKYRQNTLQN